MIKKIFYVKKFIDKVNCLNYRNSKTNKEQFKEMNNLFTCLRSVVMDQ